MFIHADEPVFVIKKYHPETVIKLPPYVLKPSTPQTNTLVLDSIPKNVKYLVMDNILILEYEARLQTKDGLFLTGGGSGAGIISEQFLSILRMSGQPGNKLVLTITSVFAKGKTYNVEWIYTLKLNPKPTTAAK